MRVFKEEQELHDKLLKEWYEEMHAFTERADGIFTEKAKVRDKHSLVWERIAFPSGFAQIIHQKVMRLQPCLAEYMPRAEGPGKAESVVDWDKVLEELGDIMNYARIFGAIIMMLRRRTAEERWQAEADKLVGTGGTTGAPGAPGSPAQQVCASAQARVFKPRLQQKG